MRGWQRSILPLAAMIMVAASVAWPSGNVEAAQAGGAWQQLALKGYTYRLLTPASGALFAQQTGGIFRSDDAGPTWTKPYERAGWRPQRVAGGEGLMPQRLYLSLIQPTSGNYLLLRSDDDGPSWAETSAPWSGLELLAATERRVLGGVDTDLTRPNRVYAGINVHRSNRTQDVPSFLFSRVMMRDDAGMSWSNTGFGGELVINDLKLGIDGQNLYASTVEGV